MDNIEISQPEEIDIANEIARLEAMYKHYKILCRKLMLLCCSNERKVVKHNRDHFKLKLKQMRRLVGNLQFFMFLEYFSINSSFFIVSKPNPCSKSKQTSREGPLPFVISFKKIQTEIRTGCCIKVLYLLVLMK